MFGLGKPPTCLMNAQVHVFPAHAGLSCHHLTMIACLSQPRPLVLSQTNKQVLDPKKPLAENIEALGISGLDLPPELNPEVRACSWLKPPRCQLCFLGFVRLDSGRAGGFTVGPTDGHP